MLFYTRSPASFSNSECTTTQKEYGLLPDTNYYHRLIATNGSGTTYGEIGMIPAESIEGFKITNFTVGHEPYDAVPIVNSFITSTETTCKIEATAEVSTGEVNPDVDWTITVPDGWTAQGQDNTLTFSQTATVPAHPDGGRPAGMQIQLKATYNCNGTPIERTVTATQSATDRIRQMYIDHNIKIPNRDEFSGGTAIEVKNEVEQGREAVLAEYRNWCHDQTISLWGRTSGYRNPEHNEDQQGSDWESLHQYGWAEDFGPITDIGGILGAEDDAAYIRNYIRVSGGRSYYFQRTERWYVHHHYRDYTNLPNVVDP